MALGGVSRAGLMNVGARGGAGATARGPYPTVTSPFWVDAVITLGLEEEVGTPTEVRPVSELTWTW